MKTFRSKIGEGGRVVIPAPCRAALGLQPGDDVLFDLDDGELRLITPERALRRIQAIVRQHVPEGLLLSEELIRERREEARRE